MVGIVVGRRVEVRELVTTKNLAHGMDRFEVDPGEVVRADVDARRRALSLVGIWHSHPRDEAVPSENDVRAMWPGHVCVIVGLGSQPTVRAWRTVDGDLLEDVLATGTACTNAIGDHNRRFEQHDHESAP